MTLRRTAHLLLLAGALAALPACAAADGDDGAGTPAARAATATPKPTSAPTPAPKPAAPAKPARTGVTITTRTIANYGEVLVDARGKPLYIFTADRRKTPKCYGACAGAWPVSYAKGRPVAKGNVQQALLGTAKRRGGRLQATYRGRPLYTYAADPPGVALCHDVREFGGLWLLVRASGKRV